MKEIEKCNCHNEPVDYTKGSYMGESYPICKRTGKYCKTHKVKVYNRSDEQK